MPEPGSLIALEQLDVARSATSAWMAWGVTVTIAGLSLGRRFAAVGLVIGGVLIGLAAFGEQQAVADEMSVLTGPYDEWAAEADLSLTSIGAPDGYRVVRRSGTPLRWITAPTYWDVSIDLEPESGTTEQEASDRTARAKLALV